MFTITILVYQSYKIKEMLLWVTCAQGYDLNWKCGADFLNFCRYVLEISLKTDYNSSLNVLINLGFFAHFVLERRYFVIIIAQVWPEIDSALLSVTKLNHINCKFGSISAKGQIIICWHVVPSVELVFFRARATHFSSCK